MVKFGMIPGAENVIIFNRICSWRVRKVASVAGRVAVCVFWVRLFSERFRIMIRSVIHWKMTFCLFLTFFSLILDEYIAWQAYYLVRLEGFICHSVHYCKSHFMCDRP